jgi:hypothetical protein
MQSSSEAHDVTSEPSELAAGSPAADGVLLKESRQTHTPTQPDDSLHQMTLQLQAAQAQLQQSRRGQSEFLWAMGHALRSPLSAILGFAQLIDAGQATLTPRQKDSLARILKAGWELSALIDQISDASFEHGKLPLQMGPVSLVDVLRDCETLVEPLARQSGAQVVFAWREETLLVSADGTRVRQIVMNLLSHALKHSGAAGVVQVSCHACADGRLRVRFQDTSGGKSSAWLGRGKPGTPIQLIVSQQMAANMGGVIASDFGASTPVDANDYWLELNAALGAV